MSLRSAHREIRAFTARRASHQIWSHAGLIEQRHSLLSASVDRSTASLARAILNALHYSVAEMRLSRLRVALCLLVVVALSALPGPVRGKLFIDLSNPARGKMLIAIPDFESRSPGRLSGKALADVLRNDLYLTGMFQIVPPSTPDGSDSFERPDFDRWGRQGAQALIVTRYESRGDQLVLEARLYNVDMRRMEMGKRYIGRTADNRLMVHRFGERVMEALTGIRGCFSSRIAFVGIGPAREIFSMDFDGHNLGQLTRSKAIVLSPEWSPDGRHLLFTGYGKGKPDLWLLDLKTGDQHVVSGRPGLNASGRYSPHGDRVALSLTYNGIPKIFIITPQGNIIKKLTSGRGNDISPTWSPDGSMIAYVSDQAGAPQIYSVSVLGGPPTRLTFETNYNTDPDWSPRGDVLAFTARVNGQFQVCTIRTDGTDFRALTSQGTNEDPAWSPDGRMIAFSSNRRGRREIFVMDAQGEIQVPVSPIAGKAPAWSPPDTQ
jgi:TolB protein